GVSAVHASGDPLEDDRVPREGDGAVDVVDEGPRLGKTSLRGGEGDEAVDRGVAKRTGGPDAQVGTTRRADRRNQRAEQAEVDPGRRDYVDGRFVDDRHAAFENELLIAADPAERIDRHSAVADGQTRRRRLLERQSCRSDLRALKRHRTPEPVE